LVIFHVTFLSQKIPNAKCKDQTYVSAQVIEKLPHAKKGEGINPSDEDYYLPYKPDYTSCEIFIRAIGYDIDESSLIGHRLLLMRLLVKSNSKFWKNEQNATYKRILEKCINKGRMRQVRTVRNPCKRVVKVKK